ncbi:SDR family NAD(P)-dependent oxidoreductase [Nocardia stercoris]|uniref:SDR family NAD(P)-dependent oxidoreductase n=1 Tax=Nocardia stercoris TaxID=2483361 RepID=A0A3M2L9E0_9NOCA|nr:SDR family NAD(P)-dependent oxidoreductase [Nocardia stercoris]RMI31188.1 SDR family NAD(P)-dependent oxidoreductase [Nocardia stercoris]
MKTIVITGGTDGIGRYLADSYVKRGDRVVVIGRSAEKGNAFVESAGGNGVFVQADLDLLASNRAVIAGLLADYPVIDALVLCARFYRSYRAQTPEGIESTLAHFYLSRYLFTHDLRAALERAERPVLVNVAGPGAGLSAVNWDDLEFTYHYSGGGALGQGGKLNDLLGVSFAERYPQGRTRYVLVHPGITATSQAGDYDPSTLLMVKNLRRHGKPIAAAAEPIIDLIDAPPAEPLSAFVEGRRIPVEGKPFDPAAARRLDQFTRNLLAGL